MAKDLLPIGAIDVRAGTAEVAEFAAALGLQTGPGSVPLTFPVRWLVSPALRGVIERMIGTPYPVQASQSFHYDAPIVSDRNYQLRIAVRQDNAPSRRLAVYGTLCDDDEHIVLRLESVLYPTNAISTVMKPTKQRSRGSSLPEIEIGPIDARQVARYAAVAHEDNRLHCDPKFARSVGLDGPILPGMMIMGLFQKALSEWDVSTVIVRLTAMFVQPVPVGSRLAIGGNIVLHPDPKAQERQIVRIFVRTERDSIVCIGEASMASDPSVRLPPVK